MTEKVILDLARSQLGAKESPMGSNHVKYNTEYYGMEVKGSQYAWCCVFQWWLFHHAGAGELFYGGGKTASCTALYRWYQKRGQAVDKKDLRPGDLVFFVFDGALPGCVSHVGICESVGPGYVVTIDGNTGGNEANGGAVARKRRSLRYVAGGARPDYNEEKKEEDGMKLYRYVAEMPQWAQAAATKAIQNGCIKMDATGAAGVWEANLQTLVWLDRLGLLDGEGARKDG